MSDQTDLDQNDVLDAELSPDELSENTAEAKKVRRPVVAVVGRPNVGKSTLFNRLVGHASAIVEDLPGVTRDRHYALGDVHGRDVYFIDTGGFDPESDHPLTENIVRQVEIALEEADVVLCVFDGSNSPVPADYRAVEQLRRTSKPVVFCANKVDSAKRAQGVSDLYTLGIDHLISVSAAHGHGMRELEDALKDALPEEGHIAVPDYQGLPRIAVIGRPNAGKSSLVNRIFGEERQIVSDIPGTTIDSIDTLVEFNDQRWVLTDTAGIRRKRAVEKDVEGLSVLRAIRALERSDIALVMIDATIGTADQDAKLVGLAVDRGCSLVLALNKWDLLNDEEKAKAQERLNDTLRFADWAPCVRISAKTGRGIKTLRDTLSTVAKERPKRVSTSEANRFFAEVLDKHPPPSDNGRLVKIYYLTQARVAPPLFVAVCNRPEGVATAYRRYVVNQLRERFKFTGAPIKVVYRPKRKVELD